ncbi:hypothetical protein C5E06_04460 [Pseudoclavibacter sp. RFBI5]|uniref:hypothetical protein n=1 Tax=Pseudoclavibacter sp. RFBI5 TaxID=2080578 RepID=UPI000CE78AF4|nr:hypothetical protein [Pseudoclavibacter sp. RFBI5]PPG04684.1 hypothetical protein C5E06_04460 [Pseudoclavibacter sp. RFBI5]
MSRHASRRAALAVALLLVIGISACAVAEEPAPEAAASTSATPTGASGLPSAPPTPEASSLGGFVAGFDWPSGMTLPVPDGLRFDRAENAFACDGRLLHVLAWSPTATDETVADYLESVLAEFAVAGDAQSNGGDGPIWDADGEFAEEGRMQNAPSAADATKIVSWEPLEPGGYRLMLQEETSPGTVTATRTTPSETWVGFPFPSDVQFEDCILREELGESSDSSVGTSTSSWTMRVPVAGQMQVQAWMTALAAEGWTAEGSESRSRPGLPDVILSSSEYTAQYSVGAEYITLFVGTRVHW